MAKVFGKSGRYVSQEAVTKRRAIVATGLISIGVLSEISGLLIGLSLHGRTISPLLSLVTSLTALVVCVAVWKWSSQKLDVLERERMNMRRGAAGEDVVARALEEFPDGFYVINDLTTPFGDLDHVVIGPTGVFVLDSKNFRGTVGADGRGELLINGEPTTKPMIKPFVKRMMDMRDKVRALAPGLDPYLKAVFVFPSARVEARWGTTGDVHCIRDEQLFDYIVESKLGTRIRPQDVKRIAQAFLGLAHMDADFTSNAEPATPGLPRTSGIASSSSC
jgi:hypothetical protein